MNPELHHIERACAPQPGSLSQILLIDPADVQSIPPWYRLPNVSEITFKPGKAPFLLAHDRLNGRLEDSTPIDQVAGDYFQYRLSCTVLGLRLEVDYLRAKLMNRAVHVAVRYHTGLERFLPNMRLTATSDTGDRFGASPRYSFSGVCQLDRPAPHLDAPLTLGEPGGGGDPGGGDPGGGGTVAPVSITTSAGSYTYTIPSGKLLLAVYVKSSSAQTVSVGTSAGGVELGGPVPLGALQWGMFGSSLLRTEGSTPIYFSGLAGTNTLEIWLLG